jgi:hypothetical protein
VRAAITSKSNEQSGKPIKLAAYVIKPPPANAPCCAAQIFAHVSFANELYRLWHWSIEEQLLIAMIERVENATHHEHGEWLDAKIDWLPQLIAASCARFFL